MTDRAKCLKLARALWHNGGIVIETARVGDWLAWPDDSSDFYGSRQVRGEGPDGTGPTKSAAIANLLRKLERLAERRAARLAKAIEEVQG